MTTKQTPLTYEYEVDYEGQTWVGSSNHKKSAININRPFND